MPLGETALIKEKYIQYIIPHSKIHITLGILKQRTDGRWDWIRKMSKYNPKWNKGGYKQGTEKTKQEGYQMLLEGWDCKERDSFNEIQIIKDAMQFHGLPPETMSRKTQTLVRYVMHTTYARAYKEFKKEKINVNHNK